MRDRPRRPLCPGQEYVPILFFQCDPRPYKLREEGKDAQQGIKIKPHGLSYMVGIPSGLSHWRNPGIVSNEYAGAISRNNRAPSGIRISTVCLIRLYVFVLCAVRTSGLL